MDILANWNGSDKSMETGFMFLSRVTEFATLFYYVRFFWPAVSSDLSLLVNDGCHCHWLFHVFEPDF